MFGLIRRFLWLVGILVLAGLAYVFFFVKLPTGELTANASDFSEGECLKAPECEMGELCPAVCYGKERKTVFEMIFGEKK